MGGRLHSGMMGDLPRNHHPKAQMLDHLYAKSAFAEIDSRIRSDLLSNSNRDFLEKIAKGNEILRSWSEQKLAAESESSLKALAFDVASMGSLAGLAHLSSFPADNSAQIEAAKKALGVLGNQSGYLKALGSFGNIEKDLMPLNDSLASYHELLKSNLTIGPRFDLGVRKLAEAENLQDQMGLYKTELDGIGLEISNQLGDHAGLFPRYLRDFGLASSFSKFMENHSGVDSQVWTRLDALKSANIFDYVPTYKIEPVLDDAGLRKRHAPDIGSPQEHSGYTRVDRAIFRNWPKAYVIEASNFLYAYEKTLRDIIDAAMSKFHGPDWYKNGLDLADCRDLEGRYLKRGGPVLNHADFVHYLRIMICQEHFDRVFRHGFATINDLKRLIDSLRSLRNPVKHATTYTQADHVALKMYLSVLRTGLSELVRVLDLEI
jgi:hypothetical protein